jgi:hypothetical protein
MGQRRVKTKTRSKQKNRRRDTRPDAMVCVYVFMCMYACMYASAWSDCGRSRVPSRPRDDVVVACVGLHFMMDANTSRDSIELTSHDDISESVVRISIASSGRRWQHRFGIALFDRHRSLQAEEIKARIPEGLI